MHARARIAWALSLRWPNISPRGKQRGAKVGGARDGDIQCLCRDRGDRSLVLLPEQCGKHLARLRPSRLSPPTVCPRSFSRP
eukprot:5717220-Pyramimonas_sp.AAC.1